MVKKWQLSKKINQEIIKNNPDINPVILQLLYNRGLKNKDEIKNFFSGSKENFHSPFLFKNMKEAVELIINHIKQQNKIIICGDYDADGVTSSAILSETIKSLKGLVDVWIPSRFGEGYGLNKNIIKELAEKNFKLLITVDNGVRNFEEIEYAKSLNIDCLITDHHKGFEDENLYPKCLIINPILEKENYPFKYLSGAGVAFKVACALIDSSKLDEAKKNSLKENILDLAAIGTIADCVSLMGENRIIVKEGLKLINNSRRPGLIELIKISGLENTINEWNVGWQITPRLNAAGRLEHANTSYELLITKNKEEAKALAQKLNEQNISRQKITQEIIESCQKEIEINNSEKIIILLSPDLRNQSGSWSEGVIGLAAGRITEKYSRPTLVICLSEGKIKGSGRSVENFDITKMLEETKECYERYGGHKMACGFTVKDRTFLEKMKEKVKK
jgi:single-stranded-DNA-specific exonuclease